MSLNTASADASSAITTARIGTAVTTARPMRPPCRARPRLLWGSACRSRTGPNGIRPAAAAALRTMANGVVSRAEPEREKETARTSSVIMAARLETANHGLVRSARKAAGTSATSASRRAAVRSTRRLVTSTATTHTTPTTTIALCTPPRTPMSSVMPAPSAMSNRARGAGSTGRGPVGDGDGQRVSTTHGLCMGSEVTYGLWRWCREAVKIAWMARSRVVRSIRRRSVRRRCAGAAQ